MNRLWSLASSLASPGGARARLTVFIYHRIVERPDPLNPGEPDAARFEQEMRWLSSVYRVLPLGEAVARLRAGTLPARSACVSFDDGYASNVSRALPILKRLGLTATFFITPGYLDGGRMWNDSVTEALRVLPEGRHDWTDIGLGTVEINAQADRAPALFALLADLKARPRAQRLEVVDEIERRMGDALPGDLMMSAGQLGALRDGGMEIGSHTMTHPILSEISATEAEAEIAAGRDWLEERLGQRVGLFAYPVGRPGKHYGPEHVAMMGRLGMDAAVSTSHGAFRAGGDLMQIPRFRPWDPGHTRFMARMCQNALLTRPDVVDPDAAERA
ncbi:MAG: polysaccharide deacetylase family protein [Gammaproteobacteria bacterium]